MSDLLNIEKLVTFIKKIGPLFGIIILIYLIYNIGLDKIITTFMKISPIYILLAVSLTLPVLLIKNYQWRLILKKQNIHISFLKSLKVQIIGRFYGNISPGYLGSYMKIFYLKEEVKEPYGKLFVNTVIHSTVNTIPLYLMMFIGAFLLIEKVPNVLPVVIVFIAVSVLPLLYFIKKERGEKTLHFLIKLFIPKKSRPRFKKFVNTFYMDFPKIRWLIAPFLIAVPLLILQITKTYIIGLSLGIEIPFLIFLFIYPISSIVAYIPISAGGLGPREATLVFLFSFYGVSPEKIIVMSLASYMISVILAGVYGSILFLPGIKDIKLSLKTERKSSLFGKGTTELVKKLNFLSILKK